MTRVVLHLDRCIGAGLCAAEAPDVFTQSDDDGTVVGLMSEIAGDLQGAAREAALVCPTQAIELVDE